MPETTAAGLLAVVGIFDIVGTIASGWLTDRFNPRLLLGFYYFFRGVGLLVLPLLLSDAVHPSMLRVRGHLRPGLGGHGAADRGAVPRGVRRHGTIVFGWVFASHQIGAAVASVAAGSSATRPASTPRLVRRCWPLPGGGHRVGHDPESSALQRVGHCVNAS